MYWDDRVELCGERGWLHLADPDFLIIIYLTLQYFCMDRYVVNTGRHPTWTAVVHHRDLWKSNCCWLLTLWLLFCLGLIALSLVLIKRFEDPKVSPGMLIIAGWGWVTQRKKWNSAGFPALLIHSLLYACPWVELSWWIIKLCFPYVNSHHPTW